MMFENRQTAGRQLAKKLARYKDTDAVVLAIPRGGVTIGYEVANQLHLALDIVLSKKIGHPLNPEFAIGSVSPQTEIINHYPNVPSEYIQQEIHRIRKSLEEKRKLYEGKHDAIDIKGKTVIVVDDGIATGNTLLATIDLLRKSNVAKVVIAVPVTPMNRVHVFNEAADEFIYIHCDDNFPGVGAFYINFEQVTDEEVILMLELSRSNTENNPVL